MYTATLQKKNANSCPKGYPELQLPLLLPPTFLLLLQPLLNPVCSLFQLLIFIGTVSTTLEQFQFQRKVWLSQINVISIPLKFKLYAVLINWGSSINFKFVGRQDTVNYWDFTNKILKNCQINFILKTVRHDQSETFAKISFRGQLVCSADFDGLTLLACFTFKALFSLWLHFWLPSFSCYHYPAVFSKPVFPLSLQCLESFSTTNNICNF